MGSRCGPAGGGRGRPPTEATALLTTPRQATTPTETAPRRPRPGGILRRLGWILILLAAIGAAYEGWLFWGTGVLTARAQRDLREEIEARIDHAEPHSGTSSRQRGSNTAPVLLEGDAVAILVIPRMDLDVVVVEGTTGDAIQRGPGHYEGTAYPWEDGGTVAIAGHRTTYGKPFWGLDRLRPGDRIRLVTEFGTFDYAVSASREVAPSDLSVLRQTERSTLVLTTCTPIFTATRRLVVFAEQIRAA